jgi:hypothetical protein
MRQTGPMRGRVQPVSERHPPTRRDPRGSRYAALRLARRFRQAQGPLQAQPQDKPGMTLQALLALHGSSSLSVLLMVFALVCILPIGGVGNVFGVALWWLSWDWLRGRSQMVIPPRLAHMRLNVRWSLRTLKTLAVSYRFAGRWSRPRLPAMQARWTRGLWAGWIALQALVIFLPVPVGNVLPAFSLVALAMGRLLEDGVALCLSLVLGSMGVAYAVALGHVTWALLVGAWVSLVG